jgi:hypothetical protein
MDKIIYYHARNAWNSPSDDKAYIGTFAVSLPSLEVLLAFAAKSITESNSLLPIRIGAAKRNKKDQFIKKVGRDLSLSRMMSQDFYMVYFQRYDDYNTIHLKSTDYSIRLHVYPNRIYISNIDKAFF